MENQTNNVIDLKVLYLEDSIYDFEIISEQLNTSNYHLTIIRVDNESDYTKQLTENVFDIILSDFNLPGFDAFGALSIQQQLCSEIPFICVSGAIGEDKAVELLKKGASDYVIKDRLGRLVFAMQSALENAKKNREYKIAEEELKKKAFELQLYYELTLGRELKMVELKKEINDLLKRNGQDKKYFL